MKVNVEFTSPLCATIALVMIAASSCNAVLFMLLSSYVAIFTYYINEPT